MSTSNVSVVRSGTGFTIDVTLCNLDPDLTIKDFFILHNGSPYSPYLVDYTKTTATVLTYTGASLPSTTVEVRRKTSTSVVQTVNFASRVSSSLWNSEFDRVQRRAEEYELNGVGAAFSGVIPTPKDDVFPSGWDGDITYPPTRNAVYDKFVLMAPLASPSLTGVPLAPTAAKTDSSTQIATTAHVKLVAADYAPLASPTFTGNPSAPTASANDNDTQLATTAFVQQEIKNAIIGLNSSAGSTYTRKNFIMNGRFDIWQRNTSFTHTGSSSIQSLYTADRWGLYTDPNGGTSATFTVTRQAHTLGQTEVAYSPSYYLRVNNTTQGTSLGASSQHRIGQNIENVVNLGGETVTISFYARCSYAPKTLGVELVQSFGTGGSPSATVTGIGGTQITLTSSWAFYSVTANVTSLAGKTIGTDGYRTSSLILVLWFQAGSTSGVRTGGGAFAWGGTGNIDISDVQVERGSFATSIDRRSFSEELHDCQRYYQHSYPYGTFPGAATTTGMASIEVGTATTGNLRVTGFLPCEMVRIPTLRSYDSVGAIDRHDRNGTGKSLQSNAPSTKSFRFTSTDTTSSTLMSVHYTLDAEY
jgi:hypothetical protein